MDWILKNKINIKNIILLGNIFDLDKNSVISKEDGIKLLKKIKLWFFCKFLHFLMKIYEAIEKIVKITCENYLKENDKNQNNECIIDNTSNSNKKKCC